MVKESSAFKFNVFLVFSLVTVLLVNLILPHSIVINFILIFFDLVATVPVIISGFKSISNKRINVDLLAAIALIVSLVEHEWASVAFINLMITSARIFGFYTEDQAKKSIESLFKLRPNKIKIKTNNQVEIIDLKQIKLGDLVVVNAGDRIPVDGLIESGVASIDQSSLTGESLPIEKEVGDQVLSSTLNLSGSLLVKTTKIGKDTTFEKLINLMKNAQNQKNNIETFADKFAANYILITLIGSILILAFTRNITLILSLLLVTCADDIAVAIPLAFWVAIARSARQGIIIKGGKYLEGLAKCKMLIVDKTGTLTFGKIKVDHVVNFTSDEKSLVKFAATAASVSDHPICRAIMSYVQKNKIKSEIPKNFIEFSGKGVKATLNNKKVLIGNIRFFNQEKIKISHDQIYQINQSITQGYNIVLVSYDQKILGFFALKDILRFGIKKSIQKLKQIGVSRIVMLTGDNESVAKNIAAEIGIDEYHANFLPEDKLNFLKKNLNSKYKIAMVGDGVNDAASLALSDIGFAMGTVGSDSAIEAADIALMNDDFSKIAETINLSYFINRLVLKNFIIWGAVNLIGLILVFTGIIGPAQAAAYNFLTDFLPLLNVMRLFKFEFDNSPIISVNSEP